MKSPLAWSLVASLSVSMACSRAGYAAETRSGSARIDVDAVLRAARGVDHRICSLAATAVTTTWSWNSGDAPFSPIHDGTTDSVTTADRLDDDVAPTTTWSPAESRLLLERLDAADACERELAVRLLSRARRGAEANSYAATLLARVNAPSASMRMTVALGVGLLADRRTMLEVAPTLARLLSDSSASVRANGAWALGRLRDGRSLTPLLQHVTDRDVAVRRAIVVSIGQLDSTRSAVTLAGLVASDPDAEVRRVAVWAIAQLRHEVRQMEVVTRALLTAVRSDRDARVREMSAWALAELHVTAAATVLGEAVASDESVSVRATAAWALGNLNVQSAPEGLIAALTSTDASLRLKASWALSEIGDPRAVPALQTAIAVESNVEAQRAQLRAILASGSRAETVVSSLLKSPLPRVREAAVRALAGASSADPWPWPWPRPFP